MGLATSNLYGCWIQQPIWNVNILDNWKGETTLKEVCISWRVWENWDKGMKGCMFVTILRKIWKVGSYSVAYHIFNSPLSWWWLFCCIYYHVYLIYMFCGPFLYIVCSFNKRYILLLQESKLYQYTITLCWKRWQWQIP